MRAWIMKVVLFSQVKNCWLVYATWISMFPQLRTEREIFCCKKLFPVLLSSAATDQLAGGYYGPELGWFLLT